MSEVPRGQGTVWPPKASPVSTTHPHTSGSLDTRQRGREALVVLLTRGLRAVMAAVLRRALLAAGWLMGEARFRHSTRPRRLGSFTPRRWHILLASVAGIKLLRLALAAVKYMTFGGPVRQERRRLQQAMQDAQDYSEWSQAAVALDALTTRRLQAVRPRQARQQALLAQRAGVLAAMRERGDTFALCSALRLDYMRHAGDTTNNSLLEAAGLCPVVPPAVQQYIDEVKTCLRFLSTCQDIPLDDRLAFFRELRHAYGRTGLVLSGGGSLGFWHFGVVKALMDVNLLPRVVSGSSAGSIGGALLCTHTDAELGDFVNNFPNTRGIDFFAHDTTNQHLRHLIRSGYIQDHDFFQGRLRRLLGDITFLDAYQRSGRILNISVTAADTKEPSRLLNYLTAPNVLIWSAVACSSAFPLLFSPQDLMAKDGRGNIVKFSETGAAQSQRRWCDGSLEEDLPMRGLGQYCNCTFFITSQCNPYVVPIVSAMSVLPRWLARMIESEFKHRCQQLLKIWPDSKFMKLVCQPWEGDINLCLPFSALPLSKSAVNFTPATIRIAMVEGQRAVWSKLPAIQAACAIEVAIDEQLVRVTRQAQQQARREKAAAQRRAKGSNGMRSSLPSWIHMSPLGLPPVESAMSLETALTSHDASAGSLSATDAPAVAAAAEGSLPGASKRARSASRPLMGSTSSREGSGHGGMAAGTALGIPLSALAATHNEQAQADAGVRATAGALVMAGIEAAAEALPELDPGTPAARWESEEGSGGSAAEAARGDSEATSPGAEIAADWAAAAGGQQYWSPAQHYWSPDPALGSPVQQRPPPLFENPRAAWADLALLGGISAAAGGQGFSLDVAEY